MDGILRANRVCNQNTGKCCGLKPNRFYPIFMTYVPCWAINISQQMLSVQTTLTVPIKVVNILYYEV